MLLYLAEQGATAGLAAQQLAGAREAVMKSPVIGVVGVVVRWDRPMERQGGGLGG